MKKILSLILALSMAAALASCGKEQQSSAQSSQPDAGASQSAHKQETLELEGHALRVFCGAGMKKAFEQIVEKFQAETGCEMQITYANAAQIQTQINTAKEGDFFIAGSEEELKPVEDMVEESETLVKHIPVLAVQPGNPKAILKAADLAKDGVRMVIGDPEATPVGKIAMKLLKDLELTDKVDIVSNTATAPAMIQALANDECDVILVWKENVDQDSAEIVDTPDMDRYVKKIPAARLTCGEDQQAADRFMNFLNSEEAENIWVSFGYELAEQ